jgi:5-methyltetrahydrofolate--homocysteine methyltransferase
MSTLERIAKRLQEGDAVQVADLVRAALAENLTAGEILDDGLIAGMTVVGERFRLHEIFLPDVLLAAKAMVSGLEVIKPHFAADDVPSLGKVVIGTVQGDLHDIGKNLVGIMLRGAGFEVIDLGNDVAPERFVQTAEETGATVVGMSALLTTTMPVMREVVAGLARKGLAGKVRTIVGGAPVSADFAREIGADAYAYDGANAVDKIKALVRASGTAGA